MIIVVKLTVTTSSFQVFLQLVEERHSGDLAICQFLK